MGIESIREVIDANIRQNGNQGITGEILNNVLNEMVEGLSEEIEGNAQAIQTLESQIPTLESQIAEKQDALVSGQNIKTLNGEPLLGEGDIVISDEELRGIVESQGERISELAQTTEAELAELAQTTDAKLTELSAENASLREQIAENEVLITDLQNMKIDKEADDYYPQLSVGVADNLAGVDEVDSEFNFRQSGGGAISDGVARVLSVKGNSTVWNQQLAVTTRTQEANGLTITMDGEKVVVDGTSSKASVIAFTSKTPFLINGHKYLMDGCPNGGSSATYYLTDQASAEEYGSGKIFTATYASGERAILIRCAEGVSFSNTTFKPRLIDLTQMFGAGNEPTTIEEFYQRIPMGVDMNAYNEGEVINMSASGIKSVGRNAWDEEWERGAITNATGEDAKDSSRIRSKNYIPIFPSTNYYCYYGEDAGANHIYSFFYDKDKNFISGGARISGKVFTTPSNAHYLRFSNYGTTLTTYKNDICINLSDTEFNGQYEAYREATEDLSIVAKYFPQGMAKAGSAHDEIRYNKQTNRWEKREIKQVDMGDLNIAKSASTGIFYCEVPSSVMKGAVYGDNLLCARYATWKGDKATASLPDKSIMLYNGASYPLLGIKDSAYADAASLKASLQGVMLYYEPSETEWVEIEEKDFNLDYSVWNCGTETAIAEGKSSALSADITYGFNAVGLLKQIKTALQAAGLM